MLLYLVHILALLTKFLHKNPTNTLYVSQHFTHTGTVLHVSILNEPASGIIDTFCEQDQQNICADVNIWKSNLV
jgi:hypothetical protein